MNIFLNRKIIPEDEALISVYDHGFLYGDGIYETMRAYDGTVFMLEKHLERLARSASLIKLSIPEADFIRGAVYRTIYANNLSNAYVRITVSRGKGPIGLDPDLCGGRTFVVMANEFVPYPDAYYEKGVRLTIPKTRRNLISAIDPRIKSLNFLNNILAKLEAKEKGVYEALMLNADGCIAEGTTSNIFFVRDSALCTPSVDSGILDGITRGVVIKLAKGNGIEVNEGRFFPPDLYEASEVFFTNTTAEVMPVSEIDHVTYHVGKITGALHELYKEEVRKYKLSGPEK